MEQIKLDKIEKIIKLYLSEYYSDLKIDFLKVISKKSYNEDTNNWDDDSCAIFMSLKKEKDLSEYKDLEFMLESVLGFEFCVDFI